MLEAYADLRLLTEDPKHLECIQLEAYKNEIWFHNDAINDQTLPPNKRLFHNKNISRAKKKKKQLEEKINSIKGIKPLKIREKIIKALQLDTQDTEMFSSKKNRPSLLYWELCGESHNGMEEVLKIHSLNLNSKKIIIHSLMPLQKGDQIYRCTITANLLYNSTVSLTKFGFNFDTSKIKQAYQDFINALVKQSKI